MIFFVFITIFVGIEHEYLENLLHQQDHLFQSKESKNQHFYHKDPLFQPNIGKNEFLKSQKHLCQSFYLLLVDSKLQNMFLEHIS